MFQTKVERLIRMDGSDGATSSALPLGSYVVFPGIEVSVTDGDAADFLAMKSAQLAALTHLFSCEGFEHQAEATKDHLRWLVCSLADEVNHLIPIALKEAAKGG